MVSSEALKQAMSIVLNKTLKRLVFSGILGEITPSNTVYIISCETQKEHQHKCTSSTIFGSYVGDFEEHTQSFEIGRAHV